MHRQGRFGSGNTWTRQGGLKKSLQPNFGRIIGLLSPRYIPSGIVELLYLTPSQLCDDSFEEHVLGYPPEKTGLHLHGLNVRSKEFKTMATEVVDAFAEKWGFIKTPTKLLHSILEVKEFSDACAVRGEWEGEPVEGFVVRTHVANAPTSGRNYGSPYKSGSALFFKIKFDEPYMMYRDWREVTKMLLSVKGPMNPSTLPKSKLKRPETKVYVNWVINEIKTNPNAFKDYNKGKGIIATREKFLAWLKSEKGEDDLESMKKEDGGISTTSDAHDFGKTVILPVAIPGCGMYLTFLYMSSK
jgi:tRNA ligase